MPNPLVPQGTLNRLKASIVWPNDTLNVTAPFLSEEGIGLAFNGPITTIIQTMTGTITSLEPYQMSTILIRMNRTQALADLYKKQLETNALMGDGTVRPDANPLSPYQIYNCGITNVGELVFNGKSAGFGVEVQGFYPVNSAAWD
jgi:hypothetical protein